MPKTEWTKKEINDIKKIKKEMQADESIRFAEMAKKYNIDWRRIWSRARSEKWELKQYPDLNNNKYRPKVFGRKGSGQPSWLEQPGFQNAVIKALKANMSLNQAYTLAGTSNQSLNHHRRLADAAIERGDFEDRFYKWMMKCEQTKEEAALSLMDQIIEAAKKGSDGGKSTETFYEYDAVSKKFMPIRKTEKNTKNTKNWQAAAWILERTRKELYSKQEQILHEGDKEPINKADLAKIFFEQIEQSSKIDKYGKPIQEESDKE